MFGRSEGLLDLSPAERLALSEKRKKAQEEERAKAQQQKGSVDPAPVSRPFGRTCG